MRHESEYPYTPPSGPTVALRLGVLQSDVCDRAGPTMSAGALVKRDLSRFYALLAATRRTISLGKDDLRALLRIGPAWKTGDAPPGLLWAQLDQFAREHPDAHPGPEDLIAKLRAMTPVETLALRDAIDRFWGGRWRQSQGRHLKTDISDDDVAATGLANPSTVAFR